MSDDSRLNPNECSCGYSLVNFEHAGVMAEELSLSLHEGGETHSGATGAEQQQAQSRINMRAVSIAEVPSAVLAITRHLVRPARINLRFPAATRVAKPCHRRLQQA